MSSRAGMARGAKVYVAGHRGLLGSALLRGLRAAGFENLVMRAHAELDLADAGAVRGRLSGKRGTYRPGDVLQNRHPLQTVKQALQLHDLLAGGSQIPTQEIGYVRRQLSLTNACV